MFYRCSHQSHNRLADLVAEHLDHLHYINDILCLNIIDLNRVLTEHLLHKLLIPLYIYSLTGFRNQTDLLDIPSVSFDSSTFEYSHDTDTANARVSSVVALFLLSQVFLIISHPPLVSTLAWIILKADKSIFEKDSRQLLEEYMNEEAALLTKRNDKKCQSAQITEKAESSVDTRSEEGEIDSVENVEEQKNATDEEKLLVTTPTECVINSPFLEAVLKALDCSENDYTALFSLSLLYALGNNKGMFLYYYFSKPLNEY